MTRTAAPFLGNAPSCALAFGQSLRGVGCPESRVSLLAEIGRDCVSGAPAEEQISLESQRAQLPAVQYVGRSSGGRPQGNIGGPIALAMRVGEELVSIPERLLGGHAHPPLSPEREQTGHTGLDFISNRVDCRVDWDHRRRHEIDWVDSVGVLENPQANQIGSRNFLGEIPDPDHPRRHSFWQRSVRAAKVHAQSSVAGGGTLQQFGDRTLCDDISEGR